jgi:hypothetical protein
LPSCEVEYIAASTVSTQALWLVRLLGDLLGRDTGVVELRVDSKSALTLAKNPVFHERRSWSMLVARLLLTQKTLPTVNYLVTHKTKDWLHKVLYVQFYTHMQVLRLI